MGHDTSVLQLEQVSRQIGRRQIVQPMSLSVRSGETVALCGGNGAGKTTLIRMVAGVTEPSGGRMELAGMDRKTDRRAYAACIGYMPDDFAFGQQLSARETIRFYAALKRVSPGEADGLLDLVGLAQVIDDKVSSFSKGMRQRLLFAQAMLGRPKLLIMDEPTNGLDPLWMNRFSELVQELRREGMAILFSTHDLHIAARTADRIILMHEGAVLKETDGDTIRTALSTPDAWERLVTEYYMVDKED